MGVKKSSGVKLAVDFRAFKNVQVDSKLNDCSGMNSDAGLCRTVGVNELMTQHGNVLLLMHIVDGFLRRISTFTVKRHMLKLHACTCHCVASSFPV